MRKISVLPWAQLSGLGALQLRPEMRIEVKDIKVMQITSLLMFNAQN